MKKPLFRMVLLLLGASTLFYCTDDGGDQVATEKVQFTCSFRITNADNGRTKTTATPDALYLSIETAQGDAVFTGKKVTLLRVGDSFMTEPLEMKPGIYYITDFMLMNDAAGVLYATPRNGSTLGNAVSHPLPFRFAVNMNKMSNINMEVIDVSAAEPESFGYTSFAINIVNPLQLSVFTQEGNNVLLTAAQAWFLKGDDTLKTCDLKATVNTISFPGAPDEELKLVITKPGFNTFVKTFVYNDLMAGLGGLPLKVTLVKSIFTFKPYFLPQVDRLFQMTLNGPSGDLSVDWGDGTVDTYTLAGEEVPVEHQYAGQGPANFQVNVTGDLDKIEAFEVFYGFGAMSTANFQGLTALKRFKMGYTHGPATVDLSNSPMLEFVMMPVVNELKTLTLPKNTVLNYMELTGPHNMTPADVDYVIDQVYHGAMVNHTMNGFFMLTKRYDDNDHLLGPPSPDRVDKLHDLKNNYGWSTVPHSF